MYPKGKSSTPPSDAQAKEKLAMYVYEYLFHVGAHKAASQFLSEIRWEKHLPVGESPGFLVQWWSVFYDLYSAAPERRETCEHSNEAKAFHDYGFVSCYQNGMNHGPGPMASMPGPQDPTNGTGLPPGFFPGPMTMEGRPCIPMGPMGPRMSGGPRYPGQPGIPSPFLGPGAIRNLHPGGGGPPPRMTPPPHHSMMPVHSVMPPYPMSPGPSVAPPPHMQPPMMGPPSHSSSHNMPSMHGSGCGPGTPNAMLPSPQDVNNSDPNSMMRLSGGPNGTVSSNLMGPPMAPVSSAGSLSGLCGPSDDLPTDGSIMTSIPSASSSGMPPPPNLSCGPSPSHYSSSQMMMLNGAPQSQSMMISNSGGGIQQPQHPNMMPVTSGNCVSNLPPELISTGGPPTDYFPGNLSHPHMMMGGGGGGPMMGMPPHHLSSPMNGPVMSSHHLNSMMNMPPSSQSLPPPPPHSMHNNNFHCGTPTMADPDNAAILKIKEQMQEDVKCYEKNYEAEYYSMQQ